MKKHFFFLLTCVLLSTISFAQAKTDAVAIKQKKSPHLTFTLLDGAFYYSKDAEAEKTKLEIVDSISVAKIIDAAIAQHKVAPKDLDVVISGDDLMQHPNFEILLHTILSKTVSEVRLKTNVF